MSVTLERQKKIDEAFKLFAKAVHILDDVIVSDEADQNYSEETYDLFTALQDSIDYLSDKLY